LPAVDHLRFSRSSLEDLVGGDWIEEPRHKKPPAKLKPLLLRQSKQRTPPKQNGGLRRSRNHDFWPVSRIKRRIVAMLSRMRCLRSKHCPSELTIPKIDLW
jgi:hypothetical protein